MRISQATIQGRRDYQEDRYGFQDFYAGTLAWVADGHGGDQVSQEIQDQIKPVWILNDHPDPVKQIEGVFRSLEARTETAKAGSTLSLIYIPKKNPHIFVAVLGDSPVIVRSGDKVFVGPNHNARSNTEERSQAIMRGAIYSGGYFWNNLDDYNGQGLQMTRALGDSELKFLNRSPEIRVLPFGLGGDWALVASDGVLDPSHYSESEADIVAGFVDAGAEASELVARAAKVSTRDNATAILVRI